MLGVWQRLAALLDDIIPMNTPPPPPGIGFRVVGFPPSPSQQDHVQQVVPPVIVATHHQQVVKLGVGGNDVLVGRLGGRGEAGVSVWGGWVESSLS